VYTIFEYLNIFCVQGLYVIFTEHLCFPLHLSWRSLYDISLSQIFPGVHTKEQDVGFLDWLVKITSFIVMISSESHLMSFVLFLQILAHSER